MVDAAPVPDDVLRFVVQIDVDGRYCSVGFWILVPGVELVGAPQLVELQSAFIFDVLAPLTSCMHDGAQLAACSTTRQGPSPLTVATDISPNHGAWTGGQVAFATLTLHHVTEEGRRSSAALLHLPGFPDAFTDDHARLNPTAWFAAVAAGEQLVANFNSTPGIDFGPCVLGVLHRRSAAGPLHAAVFSPTQTLLPGPNVGCLRRRRGNSRAISPS